MYGIVKYSSSSKLKPTFFPEGGNSISYVITLLSLNGVDVISSFHGIRLRSSESWIWTSGYCWRSKEPVVCLSSMERWILDSSNQIWWSMRITKCWSSSQYIKNSFSSCIFHEITPVWPIIKLLYCSTSINDEDSYPIFWYVCIKVLFHAIVSNEHHHAIYSQFDGRDIWHTDMQNTRVLSCDLSSVEELSWY